MRNYSLFMDWLENVGLIIDLLFIGLFGILLVRRQKDIIT